jgi:cell division protein FtsW
MSRLRRAVALAAFAAGLAVLCALQLLCIRRAPSAWAPARIDITLAPGESVLLGRQELAAPQADRAHLALRRDLEGRWWASNVSASHPMIVERDGKDSRSGSMPLQAGQQFQLGASQFTIDGIGHGALEFTDAGHRWSYDGSSLSRDGAAQPPCPDARLPARVASWFNRHVPPFAMIRRPLLLGGNLHCGNRLGVPRIARSSATIRADGGQYVLASAGAAPLMTSSSGTSDLARREEPLARVSSIVVGRTRLRLALDGATAHLLPASHVALFEQAQAGTPAHVRWQWRRRDPWALPVLAGWQVAAIALAVLLALVLGGWRAGTAASKGARLAAFTAGGAGPAIAVAGAAFLVLHRLGLPAGAAVSMLLAWCALWYALLVPRRFSLLAGAAVLLCAAGLLAQLELGFGAMESSWLRHFQKTAALLAVGLGSGMHLATARAEVPISQQRVEWLLLGAAALAVTALVLQVALGDETGVFDLQPVEFAKLALAALTAHCIALAAGTQGSASAAWVRWMRLFAPAVLFIALLAVALVQVDDYSPLVLLLVWAMSMSLAWALAARHRGATVALAGMGCVALLAVAALRTAGAQEIAQWSFYTDRFLVWLDPASHPHTGQQLLLGARAIADGGWLGADGLFGLASLGQQAGEVMRIPAVQDDFAPSFFLNRHGLSGALALWSLQALLVVALLRTAMRNWLASKSARDFRHAWLARFRCFALCGGAAFLLGHFLLSWGTNLAIFPVMGQPMSFLSAGGSHLLFFICPLLAFGAASAHTLEEI